MTIQIAIKQRFETKIGIQDNNNNCWNWHGAKSSDGYGSFRFEGKVIGAHRMAYMLYNNVTIMNEHVLHKCDNPACVNPEHLFLGTASDNAIDKVQKGRHNNHKGEAHPRVKLTEAIVKKIREESMYIAGNLLAKKYDVTAANISSIKNRKSWAHI